MTPLMPCDALCKGRKKISLINANLNMFKNKQQQMLSVAKGQKAFSNDA